MEGSAFDPEARVARIAERVDNQGARITHLETVVSKGFSDLQQTFGKQLSDLSAEMRTRDRTPWGVIWPALGVMFAILFGVGGALYYPVRETMGELKAEIRRLDAVTTPTTETALLRELYDVKIESLQRQVDDLRAKPQ